MQVEQSVFQVHGFEAHRADAKEIAEKRKKLEHGG